MRAAHHPLQVWDPLAVGNQAPRTFMSDRRCVHRGVRHARIVVDSQIQLHVPSFSSFVQAAPVDQFQDHP
jgi:hypothetical protein